LVAYSIFFSSGDGSCGGKKCHRNADCVVIDSVKQCQCREGFMGSGLICVGTSCLTLLPSLEILNIQIKH
jgi:hypothetical protein